MNLLIIGAGGHGKCCYDIALRMGVFNLIDVVDDHAKEVFGKKIVGTSLDLENLRNDYDYAFVGIGNNRLRADLIQKLEELGYRIATLIDPTAFISQYSEVLEGTVIFPNCVIEATAKVGKGCIISSLSVVHHDAVMEDYSLVYSQCAVRPYSKVDSFATVQSGTIVGGN